MMQHMSVDQAVNQNLAIMKNLVKLWMKYWVTLYLLIYIIKPRWCCKIETKNPIPIGVNIADADSVRPIQLVPSSLQSTLDAFKLTLPISCIEMLLLYINQKYDQYCQQNSWASVVKLFKGPISKEKVLAIIRLSLLFGAHKCNQQPISHLYDQRFLPHFKAAISRERLLLLIKICFFDNAEIQHKRKKDRFGRIHKIWHTFSVKKKTWHWN